MVLTANNTRLRGHACLLQVNSRLQTSNPDVYAVGDIALFPQPRFGGERARQEHVQVPILLLFNMYMHTLRPGCGADSAHC